MLYCTKCGHTVHETARACPQCGAPQRPYGPVSDRSRLVALLLCFFLGALGVHRFYVGKTGTGIVWLLTLGCFGIGALIDFISIAAGNFKDGQGLPVKLWETESP